MHNGAVFTVYVRGIECYAYHGVPEEERAVGHRYRIDLEIEVEGDAGHTDSIRDTVDYSAAAKLVTSIARTEQFRTLERLAQVAAERILAAFERAQVVHVDAAKRLPPADVIAETAGVRLVVRR